MANNNVQEFGSAVAEVNTILEKHASQLEKTASSLSKYNAELKVLPSGYLTIQKEITAQNKEQKINVDNLKKSTENLTKAIQQETLAKKKEVQAILDTSKSYSQLEKQKNKAIADTEKETLALAKAENIYNKVQAKVNGMIPIYNNLQAKQKLGLTLTAKEESQLTLLTNRLNKYQNVLKETDITIGKHGREVGNYAKGTSNLSMAIGQISRELPNFGQSLQIGIMSLTNNIGALIDGVKQVKLQNIELKKQGLETKSALSQVLTGLFSWQTALFVGVGLLNAYGKEIGEFVTGLFNANSVLKELAENQKKYNEARFEGKKDAVAEISELKKYLSVVKDKNISDEERLIALKKLRSEYPFYFKNLTDEQILLGKSEKAVEAVMTALEKRKEIEKKTEISNVNKQKLLDLEKELDSMKDLEKATLKQLEIERNRPKINDRATAQAQRTKELKLEERYNSAKERQIVLTNQIDVFNKSLIKTDSDIFQLKKETIALEYQEEKVREKHLKQKREKVHLNFEEIESEYNLKLAILERQKAEANDRATNEQSLLDDRLKARKEFSEKSIEILNLEVQKEKALFNEKMVDDLEKNNVAYKNKDITSKEWAKNIVAINKRYNNEIATVDMAFSLKWNDLLNADADFYYKIQEEKRAFTEKTNDLILQNEKDKNKKIADNQVSGVKFTLAVRQKAFEEFIRLSKKELDIAKAKELANAKSNEEVIFITEKYAKLIEQLGLIPSETQKAQEATEAYIRSLGNGAISKAFDEIGFSSAKMFLDIDENGQSTFDKLYEGANELGEKFALVFQSIGDIAQEVLAKMAEASTERLNKEISNLTIERDVALAFAGENTAGREEIERQFEARKKQAEIRDFERKKKIAKANVLIDTAQAIISLYAENNWVTATILGGILTGVSLYQMAQIDKQQPPAYEHGTDNHVGGLMKINDQKGSNYKEIVQTPDGKIRMFNERNKVLNAPKGTKVFTASESALMFDNGLNNMLLNNGISMPKVEVNNNGALTNSQVNAIVGAIKNKETTNINIDKSGLNTFVRDGHTTKQIVNNRVRGIGKKV